MCLLCAVKQEKFYMDISKVGYEQFKRYAKEYHALITFIENYDPRCKIIITEEDFIDNNDLCMYMQSEYKTTYRLRRSRHIPYFKVRKKIYYRLRDVRSMIEKGYFPNTDKSIETLIKEYGESIKQRQSRR